MKLWPGLLALFAWVAVVAIKNWPAAYILPAFGVHLLWFTYAMGSERVAVVQELARRSLQESQPDTRTAAEKAKDEFEAHLRSQPRHAIQGCRKCQTELKMPNLREPQAGPT
jgi:hypothetical protein